MTAGTLALEHGRGVGFDPLRDKSYEATALGPDIAAFLEWAGLGGMSERTRDQYERDLAKGAGSERPTVHDERGHVELAARAGSQTGTEA